MKLLIGFVLLFMNLLLGYIAQKKGSHFFSALSFIAAGACVIRIIDLLGV